MMTSMRLFEKADDPAISQHLAAWQSKFPDMGVLALVSEKDREKAVPLLQDVCSKAKIPLAGAIFPALVANSRFYNNGCLLIRFDTMPATAIYEPLKPSDPASPRVIERMATDIVALIDQPRDYSLFMIFDAMVVNIATILDALYLKLADRVRYMGVNAGSETFRPMPCLFDNKCITQDGVLTILLPNHPGAVVEHCYLAPERMISATSTEGSRIITIDWRPAFEVYREAVEAEYGVKINTENFYQYAVHFPFGTVRAGGEIVVRIPVALEKDGSLFCVGEVPPNALLTLLRAPAVDSVQTVETLARGLRTLSGELSNADVLAFYCAGRRMHLGEQAQNELIELDKHLGAAHLAGALSLGEIGHSMQWGYPLFHNGALLCCRWS